MSISTHNTFSKWHRDQGWLTLNQGRPLPGLGTGFHLDQGHAYPGSGTMSHGSLDSWSRDMTSHPGAGTWPTLDQGWGTTLTREYKGYGPRPEKGPTSPGDGPLGPGTGPLGPCPLRPLSHLGLAHAHPSRRNHIVWLCARGVTVTNTYPKSQFEPPYRSSAVARG